MTMSGMDAAPHTLDALRAQGLDQHAPVRFRYLEALAARMDAQPTAVRQVLAQRLHAQVQAYALQACHAEHGQRCAPGTVAPASAAAAAQPSPLARLNRELAGHAGGALSSAVPGSDEPALSDLKSVREFGEVWSRIAADAQVARALVQAPENAGPLNSHKLVLRTLALMRELSPGYLRRFLAQVDALMSLEQAAASAARPAGKSARGGRRKG